MKRLLTYLLILTAVSLARPLNAQKMTVHLWADDSHTKDLELESNNPWKKTISGEDFKTWGVVNAGKVYMLPKVDHGGTNTYYYYNFDNFTWLANGNSYRFYKYDNPGKDCGIELPENYTAYNFTFEVSNFNSSDKYIDFKVSWEKPRYNLQLKSDLDGWTGTPSESSTGYTWTWDKSKLSNISSGTKIKFKLYDADDKKWYGVSGSSDTEATSSWQSCVEDGSNWYVTYYKGNTYTIDAQRVNGTTWQVKVTTNEEDHDYYWVSPQVTNNQKWPYFKLTALRNRSGSYGDGKISDKYFTFTIKNDDLRRYDGTAINNGEKIEWYIARDDDEVWFRPSTDDPTPSASDRATSLNIGNAEGHDGNIGYRNFNDCKVYDATNTNKFAFKKGANSTKTGESDYLTNVKSYTFILNAKTSSDATKGNVYFNYAHNDSPVTSGDCYLLGNFKSASEAESVCNPWDTKYEDDNQYGPRKMTKYWYVGSTKYDSEQNPCDSIVYEIKVDKPAAGWGNLYLDVNPGSNTSWNKVYRPLISLGNKLDGRALIGGLTTAGANMDNGVGDQSLNPETSNDYTSYTFRFNATTYTYRLEFHTSLYLVGPGVSATEGQGSWDLRNVASSDPRIRLTPTQEKGHYRNRVYFTKGGQFRFIRNTDESATPNYKYTWYENTNKPLWESAASDDKYYPGNETQFRNYMEYENNTGSESSTEPTDATGKSMTFDLPTGWYYVNFYPNAGTATAYYTIEHSMELRDFNEVYYRSATVSGEQRTVEGRNSYNFLRVWSDHIAWNKPDNIDVFVVSEFDHNTETDVTTAKLTKLDINYIPAKTGVILGCKLSKDNLTSGLVYNNAATLAYTNTEKDVNYYNTLTAELTPYSAPSTYYDGASKLIPLYSAESLKRFSDETGIKTGDGYANYLFGFYRRKKYKQNYSGDDKIFDLGFWLTTGEGKTYANSAFLHLTKAQAEDLGVGTAYNTSSTSAPAFMLLFDESDDNVITGISDITTAKGNSVAPQGWYTLQGVRTAKPTQRGIYIYNGKKVIVND